MLSDTKLPKGIRLFVTVFDSSLERANMTRQSFELPDDGSAGFSSAGDR